MKNLKYCWSCGNKLIKKKDEGRNRFYCKKCGKFIYRNAVPVSGVFVVKDSQVLLIKRGGEPNKNKWSYPAGYLEYDERPETGAIRELLEETNLSTKEKQLTLIDTIQLEHPDKYVVGNAYAVNIKHTEGEVKAGSDAKDAEFWTVREMRERRNELESEKIIYAAEKAINLVQKD